MDTVNQGNSVLFTHYGENIENQIVESVQEEEFGWLWINRCSNRKASQKNVQFNLWVLCTKDVFLFSHSCSFNLQIQMCLHACMLVCVMPMCKNLQLSAFAVSENLSQSHAFWTLRVCAFYFDLYRLLFQNFGLTLSCCMLWLFLLNFLNLHRCFSMQLWNIFKKVFQKGRNFI